jgi:hypothetical protein
LEGLLIVVAQFLTEVVGSALVSIPFDFGRKTPTTQRESESNYSYFLFFAIGGAVGWMSVQLLPQSVLPYSWLRIVNLAVAPLVAGLITRQIAIVRAKENLLIEPRVHFWRAFWFTLALAFIRFAYATH